jgi:hypothetical protein
LRAGAWLDGGSGPAQQPVDGAWLSHGQTGDPPKDGARVASSGRRTTAAPSPSTTSATPPSGRCGPRHRCGSVAPGSGAVEVGAVVEAAACGVERSAGTHKPPDQRARPRCAACFAAVSVDVRRAKWNRSRHPGRSNAHPHAAACAAASDRCDEAERAAASPSR